MLAVEGALRHGGTPGDPCRLGMVSASGGRLPASGTPLGDGAATAGRPPGFVPRTVPGGWYKAQDGGRRQPDSGLQCGNGPSAAG
jgi:hypothetical protein